LLGETVDKDLLKDPAMLKQLDEIEKMGTKYCMGTILPTGVKIQLNSLSWY